MESRENPIYGRKIFFLNMPFNIKKLIIGKLQELEYEVYLINDYKNAKNILRHYSDSICFVDIDSTQENKLSVQQWFYFLKSFDFDKQLKTIYIGVLSGHVSKADRTYFMLHASFPAGFITLNQPIEDLTQIIIGILEINGAKGRRKYVRAKCRPEAQARIQCRIDEKEYALPIIDISSIGLSCSIPVSYCDKFPPNTVLRNARIFFGIRQVQCSAAVLMQKQLSPTKYSLILLYLQSTLFSVRNAIRQYVFRTLNQDVIDTIKNEKPDTETYTTAPFEKSEEAFLLNEDEDQKGEKEASPETNDDSYSGTADDLVITNLF